MIGVAVGTLAKAIQDGRLHEARESKESTNCNVATDRSDRSGLDAKAGEGIGIGCTNTVERFAASQGIINGVRHQFECAKDVMFAGVLFAIPAILQNGLLSQVIKLGTTSGYYTRNQVYHLLL